MKSPLRKRLPRELKGEIGKYLVVLILMIATIGFVSGFLVADGSMIKAYNEGFEKYKIEDGNFRVKKKITKAQQGNIEKNGVTLSLADVQWSSSEQTDGAGGTVTRYTAAASYTGTSSYQYATGYTVTANYTGEVAKTGCSVVTYTAIFGSMEAPEESTEPESGNSTASAGVDLSTLKMPLLVGGVVVILAAGGVFVFKKLKERR